MHFCACVHVASASSTGGQTSNRGPNRGRGRGRGRGSGRGAGRGTGRGAGRGRGRGRHPGADRGDTDEANFQSYDSPDTPNPLPPFSPTRPPGVHFGRPLLRNAMTRAVEFFYLFFTVEMIDSIVAHTNSYAQEKIFSGSFSTYAQPDGSWKDVTADEIKRFIACLIYFGLVNVRGDVSKNWSTKTLYHGLWSRAILSRKRFFAILGMLHVVDPATETPGDKLRKVQSFVSYFKTKCKELYQPKQHVAIDERMVKSRHRSGIRQFIKDKPTKWGIKLWVLADSSNGYTIDFNIYIGRAAGRDISEYGLGYDVVMCLMDPYFHQGYHLYVDNFYTSVNLMKHLFERGVPATGTILETRRSFPARLKNSKEWAKGKERGSMRWERDPPCLVLQWVDNKVVSMITTVGNANDHIRVDRKTKEGNVWSKKSVQQPQTFQTYNKYMNAVDRSDQILTTNSIQRKCMKWWKTMFYHLIDMAVVNSYILFLEHRTQFPDNEDLQRPAGYSQTEFREEIVRQICGFPEYGDPPICSRGQSASPEPSLFDTQHMPVFSDKRRNCVVCYKQGRGEKKVFSHCSAEQCKGKFMHITREFNCFQEFHSREYHGL